jgi:hypothetical protein
MALEIRRVYLNGKAWLTDGALSYFMPSWNQRIEQVGEEGLSEEDLDGEMINGKLYNSLHFISFKDAHRFIAELVLNNLLTHLEQGPLTEFGKHEELIDLGNGLLENLEPILDMYYPEEQGVLYA